jgi:hypothetical protein
MSSVRAAGKGRPLVCIGAIGADIDEAFFEVSLECWWGKNWLVLTVGVRTDVVAVLGLPGRGCCDAGWESRPP